MNGYGKDFAIQFRGGLTEAESFQAIENVNSDNDPTDATNIAEINANAQPGWTPGANNTIYARSNLAVVLTNQNPPATVTGDLDPPAPAIGAKVGAYRPSTNTFYLDSNGSGTWNGCATDACIGFGIAGDVPLLGDWNGTGTARVGSSPPRRRGSRSLRKIWIPDFAGMTYGAPRWVCSSLCQRGPMEMGQFADHALQTLGIRLPGDYVSFMQTYGKKLSEDPVHKESWVGGLGSTDFVVGTTLAFRSTLTHFRKENVVIGYVGVKTIIINKVYEDIDEYLMLDTRDGSVLAIDSLGASNKIAASFEEWITPARALVARFAAGGARPGRPPGTQGGLRVHHL